MEGDNSPYGYSITAEQNARAMLAVSPDLTLCVSGPYPNDEWADHSLKPISDIVRLVSFHQYTNFPDYGTDDLKTEYERKLGELEACRDHLIQVHDKSYGVNTSFDEWNVWYAWYRPSSVYDGIFYARMLHLIIGEAAACGIAVACQFEAVNEGLMVVRPEGVELTAAGKMYALMSRHCGGRIIKSTKNLLATEKDGITTLTFINSSYDQTAELTLHECSVKRAELFSSEEIRPYTNFAETELTGKTADKTITYSIPPHSVAAVTINGALK